MGLLRIKPCWLVPYPGSISFVDALQLGHREAAGAVETWAGNFFRYLKEDEILFSTNRPLGTSGLQKKWRNDISLQHGISPLTNTHKYNNHRDNCEVLLRSTILEAVIYSKQWKVKNLDSWLAIKPGSPKKTCEFLKLLSIQPFVFCAMFNRSRIPGHGTLDERLDFQKTFKNWLLTRSSWEWRPFTVRNDLTRNSNRDFAKPGNSQHV